jgi:hypothetical protein
MGAHRVQIKEALPWFFRWALRAGTGDFCPALAALVGPVKNIFCLAVHYFNLFFPTAPASWAGSRAGSPFSYVSLGVTPPPPPPYLKVHKIENFFGSDFEFCVISLLIMLKY